MVTHTQEGASKTVEPAKSRNQATLPSMPPPPSTAAEGTSSEPTTQLVNKGGVKEHPSSLFSSGLSSKEHGGTVSVSSQEVTGTHTPF